MADRQPDAYAPDMLAAKECTSPLIIREAVLWLTLQPVFYCISAILASEVISER